ncbi:MAG TPA: tetratricopeptide repeat protein, partial [Flavisolibacter sp.]
MTRALLLFLILWTSSTKLPAQNVTPEAAKKQLLLIPRKDSTYVNGLIKISQSYLQVQIDSALVYANRALSMAQKQNLPSQLRIGYNVVGRAYYTKGLLDEALYSFQQAEKYSKQCDQKSDLLKNQGNVYVEKGDPAKALELYKRSLALSQSCSDNGGIGLALVNIGYVLRQSGKYDEAIHHLLSAIKIFEKANMKAPLGNGYIQLAVMQYRRKIYDDAAKYALAAKAVFTELNQKGSVAMAYTILGGVASEQSQYDVA